MVTLVNLRLVGALFAFARIVYVLKAITPSSGPSLCFSKCISWSDKKSLEFSSQNLSPLYSQSILASQYCHYLKLNHEPKYLHGLTCKLLSLNGLRTNSNSWKYFQILQNQQLHYWYFENC